MVAKTLLSFSFQYWEKEGALLSRCKEAVLTVVSQGTEIQKCAHPCYYDMKRRQLPVVLKDGRSSLTGKQVVSPLCMKEKGLSLLLWKKYCRSLLYCSLHVENYPHYDFFCLLLLV